LLTGVLFAAVLFCAGCREPASVGQPLARATARYGPLEPVELLSPEAVVGLATSYGPSPSPAVAPGQWPLKIRLSNAKVKTVVIWRELTMIDGVAQGDSADAWFVAQTAASEVFSSVPFSRVLTAVKTVRLVQRDEPGPGLTLKASQIRTLGAAMDLGLKEPEGGYGGAPYPDYQVELVCNSGDAYLDWTRREYITLWTPGVLGKVSRYDPEGRAWQVCLAFFPPTPQDERVGLNQLFGGTSVQVTGGGGPNRSATSDDRTIPLLVRLLRRGLSSSEPAPTGKPSLVATFTDAEHEWPVGLYRNGFTFENTFYRLDNAQKDFLSLVNGGLAGLLLSSGCREPTPVSQSLPRATACYGPLGPVTVSAETVLALVSNLGPSPSSTVAPGQWPLTIELSDAQVKTVVIWNEMVVIDGQAKGDSWDAWLVAQSVRFEVFSSVSFPRGLRAAKTVRLVQRDEPGPGLTLNASQIGALGGAADLGLKEPEGGYGGAPYPDYQVELTYSLDGARLEWTRREYITLWTPGVLGQVSRHDPEGRAWQACLALFPLPPQGERVGLKQLFGATDVHVAASGDPTWSDTCSHDWVLSALVRLLRRGEPSSEPAPAGKPSLVATFTYAEHEWPVGLYRNGFTFEGIYYRLVNTESDFMSVLNGP